MIDKGWIEAGNLTESDVLLCSNGSYCKIDCINIERFDYYIDVYNFEVEQFHTYFVGENSIFVHNAVCGGMHNLRLMGLPSATLAWYKQPPAMRVCIKSYTKKSPIVLQ